MKRILLVVMALMCSACGYGGLNDLPLPGGTDFSSGSYRVSVDFDDVLSLTRQSSVKVDLVTVGTVEKIERKGWQARIVLKIRNDVKLPANARARIGQTGLLGEKFVELTPPADGAARGKLADGDVIPVERAGRGLEVEEVLSSLSLLLNGGGIAELKTITAELHQALDRDRIDARGFLRQLNTFVATLDRNRSAIVTTLENLNRLSTTINKDRQVVEQALDKIPPALDTLADQRKQLVTMIEELSTLGTTGSRVITEVQADLIANLKSLDPILLQLRKSGSLLPETLETILSYPFPDAALDAIKGDYVNTIFTLNLSPGLTQPGPSTSADLPPLVPGLLGSLTDMLGPNGDPLLPGSPAGPGATPDATQTPAPPAGGLLELLLGGGS